jgi:hypothetical protein
LLARETDYFVVDSFTTSRCENAGLYATNPTECDFFADLLAGDTSYELIGEFAYTLPRFLPQIEIAFVNPEIWVFEKKVELMRNFTTEPSSHFLKLRLSPCSLCALW